MKEDEEQKKVNFLKRTFSVGLLCQINHIFINFHRNWSCPEADDDELQCHACAHILLTIIIHGYWLWWVYPPILFLCRNYMEHKREEKKKNEKEKEKKNERKNEPNSE